MSNIKSAASGPDFRPSTPLEAFLNEIRPYFIFFSGLFDDPEAAFQELTEEILSLGFEERFTASGDHVREWLVEQVGEVEAIKETAPDIGIEQFGELMVLLCDELARKALESLERDRDAEAAVALISGFVTLRIGFRQLDQSHVSEEDREQIVSAMFALFARLYQIGTADDPESIDERALIRDIGGVLYYVSDALDDESEFLNPADGDFEDVRRDVLGSGAALGYPNLPISVGRGSELGDISRFEFEVVLDRHDIEICRGPSSASELYEDGVGILND